MPRKLHSKSLNRTIFVSAMIAVTLCALVLTRREGSASAAGGRAEGSASTTEGRTARIAEAYGNLPLSFEVNRGQKAPDVKFSTRGHGYELLLKATEASLALSGQPPQTVARVSEEKSLSESLPTEAGERGRSALLHMRWLHANRAPRISGIEELPGRVNYLTGSQPEGWRTGIRTYSRVRYESVYPGIDLIFYGHQQQLEYDFEVAPGADAALIRLAFDGLQKISLTKEGQLLLSTGSGDVILRAPQVYQTFEGLRNEVACQYVLRGEREVAFKLGAYDRSRPLVIDPVLAYSTFFGANSSSQAFGIAVDAVGNAYITGNAYSNFPTTPGALQPSLNGGPPYGDAFVVKLNATGTAVLYSTYLGGSSDDVGQSIAVDSAGNAHVVGATCSQNFPVVNAYQGARGGGASLSCDAFAAKLNSAGSALLYSTYLGGAGFDAAYGVALDASGNAYVAGDTSSSNFPSASAAQPVRAGRAFYRSTNGGALWNDALNSLPASVVNAFAIDPTNSAVIYAGTDQGVFRSTDRGSTWTAVNNGMGNTILNVVALAIDPTNSNIVYAGLSNALVFKTLDAGGTWTATGSLGFSASLRVLLVDPATPTNLLAGTNLGVYKSTDGGSTWTLKRDNGFSGVFQVIRAMVFDPTNASVVYVVTNTNGTYKSTNAGDSFTKVGPTFSGGRVFALAVDPAHPSTLYGGGDTGFYISTNGGASWTLSNTGPTTTYGGATFTPSVLSVAVDPSAQGTLYAGTYYGGLFKSTDGGVSWSAINNGLGNSIINKVVVDPTNPARLYAGANAGGDGFITKLSSTGSLIYSTYVGGSELERGRGLAVDAGGNAYLAGYTFSPDLPLLNPEQAVLKGTVDGFVTKLNPNGTALVYSTYLGGSSNDYATGVAVNAAGNAYVTGHTISANFPTTPGAYDTTCGSSGTCIYDNTLPPEFIASDGFVTKLSTTGSTLDYSTYFGGDYEEFSYGIALDADGNAYVTGATYSLNFPTLDPVQSNRNEGNDVFVLKLNATGTALGYSTYLGGIANDQANSIALDSNGNAYVAGVTDSGNFPTVNPLQAAHGDTQHNIFISKLTTQASATVNLSVTNTDRTDPIYVGGQELYDITITNKGVTQANVVTLTDTLPEGATDITFQPFAAPCSVTGRTITCNMGSLRIGAVTTLSVRANLTKVGTFTNTVTVSANEPDSDSSDNMATQDTTVFAGLFVGGRVVDNHGKGLADVTITLSGSSGRSTQTDANGDYLFMDVTGGQSYQITPSKQNYSFTPFNFFINNLSQNQTVNFTGTLNAVQFSSGTYIVRESSGVAVITVTRTGETSTAAKVTYSTSDGTAHQRSDYTFASGTLSFAPGETSKNFNVLIINNGYVDGTRFINLTLSDPIFTILGSPSAETLTIQDDDAAAANSNPIDDPGYFVTQQYADFLNRQPDAGGLGYWANEITRCGSDQQCIHDRRVAVSDAFFFEAEYQQTGGYIYRVYKAGLGQRPSFAQFIADRGQVVAGPALDQSKSSYALSFVQRSAFLSLYPRTMTADQFLDALLNSILLNSGVDLSAQKSVLKPLYDGTDNGRGAILRQIADSTAFVDAEYNRSFVLMEYFGYLRRDPDQGGFDFWLAQVNKFPLRNVDIQHAMACSFITSEEYQTRFSPVVTHSNRECPQ